jgi:hypothetical protein
VVVAHAELGIHGCRGMGACLKLQEEGVARALPHPWAVGEPRGAELWRSKERRRGQRGAGGGGRGQQGMGRGRREEEEAWRGSHVILTGTLFIHLEHIDDQHLVGELISKVRPHLPWDRALCSILHA